MKGREAPNFFLAGYPKSGTTTLYEYLSLHPDVFVPEVKEPAYFSYREEYERGMTHYLSLHYQEAEGFRAVGDATPWYAAIPLALQRIQTDLPADSHRFVLILRNPAERAYSMYWDQVRVGRESRDFDVAIHAELEQGRGAVPPEDQQECTTRYLWTSSYDKHIKVMDDMFGTEATLVLIQDDLADDDRRELLLRDLAAFLGVNAGDFPQEERRANVAKSHRSAWLAKSLSSPGPVAKYIRRVVRGVLPVRWRRRLASRLARMNYRPAPYPPLSTSRRERLDDYFSLTIEFVERRIGRGLPEWRMIRESAQ